jgi:biofilm PGA synthesis N-glycosyltransferase PgaC
MRIPGERAIANQTYALITAAHNEEAFIGVTIRAVVGQSVLPLKWVIVSDASTDRTDEIVLNYARDNPFIELVRLDEVHRHDFAAKAHAIKAGYESLNGLGYGYIGILDADTSFDPDYYGKLLELFIHDPRLGITGGFIYEDRGGVFTSRRSNRAFSVAGATQFFRRECFEEVGGILPLRYGGEDWCAEVSARMMGWKVRASPKLRIFHHRTADTVDGWLLRRFQQGKMDYSLGCLPAFEVVKCAVRMSEKPVVLGGCVRFAGFTWSYCVRADRSVSREFIRFLQKEQKQRLFGQSRHESPRDN